MKNNKNTTEYKSSDREVIDSLLKELEIYKKFSSDKETKTSLKKKKQKELNS